MAAVTQQTPCDHHQRNFMLILLLIALVAVLLIILFPKGTASKALNPQASLTACLRQKGVTMYGSDTCQDCQNQKQMFGAALTDVNFVNCDFHHDICDQQKIHYFPTWSYAGQQRVGIQSLPELAAWSSCSYPAS